MTPEHDRFVLVRTTDGPRALDIAHVVELLPMVAVDRFPGEGGPSYVGALRYRGALAPLFSLVDTTDPLALVDHTIVMLRTDAGDLVAVVVADVIDVIEVDPSARASLPSGGSRRIEGISWQGSFVRCVRPEGLLA